MPRLSKYEKIERKIQDAEGVNFSRWTPKRVAEHLIAASRQCLREGTLYEFPGYCEFPYNLYENKWVIWKIVIRSWYKVIYFHHLIRLFVPFISWLKQIRSECFAIWSHRRGSSTENTLFALRKIGLFWYARGAPRLCETFSHHAVRAN